MVDPSVENWSYKRINPPLDSIIKCFIKNITIAIINRWKKEKQLSQHSAHMKFSVINTIQIVQADYQ